MSDEIFAYRDRFVARFAKIFRDEGWKADFRKRENYWSFLKSFSDFDVSTSFSGQEIRQLTRTPLVNFSTGLSKPDLNTIAQKIIPPKKGFEALPVIIASFSIKDEIPVMQEDHDAFIRGLSDQIVQWAEAQDVESCIASFARPWETEKQSTHLAALAYVGDFNTLMDYQEMFKRGKRANFYPVIKVEMIDRALDIALDHSTSAGSSSARD